MRRLVLLFVVCLIPLAPVAAQSAAHDSVYKVVTDLFDSMRARDTSSMRAAFTSNASMQALTADSVEFASVDGWINSVARARPGVLLDERLANPVVQVDGALATVWVDYWFFVGTRQSHCGVDAFQLHKQNGQWRIFSVVDTRRAIGCPDAPNGTNAALIDD